MDNFHRVRCFNNINVSVVGLQTELKLILKSSGDGNSGFNIRENVLVDWFVCYIYFYRKRKQKLP